MAHKAKLEIDGKTYNVIECNYEIEQPTDKDTGIPTAAPKGGKIDITITALDDMDLLFHEWMLNKVDKKDGELTFEIVSDGKPATKTVGFKDAYCVKMKEAFNAHDDKKQMLMTVTLKATEMSFGGGALSMTSWIINKFMNVIGDSKLVGMGKNYLNSKVQEVKSKIM